MRTFTKSIVCVAAFAALSLSAAEVINLTEKGVMKRNIGQGDIVYGENQFTIPGRSAFRMNKPITIDPAKTYTFKVTFANNTARKPMIYVGWDPINAKNLGGPAYMWQGKNETFTQLSRDAKKGDTMIYVKDGKAWRKAGHACFAAYANADGSDLPNRNIFGNNITSVKQEGEEWVITFKTPLKKDIPANTNVRQHYSGGYLYVIASKIAPNKESTFTKVIKGCSDKVNLYNSNIWPRNAAKAVLVMLLDWGNDKEMTPITIKDATLTIE